MAKSGYLNTTNFEGRYLQFSWTARDYDINNIQTTIDWTLKGAGTGQVGYYYTGNIYLRIDGNTAYHHTGSRFALWNGTHVASGSFTFTHEGDGSRNFDVYLEAGIYTYAVNCSGSGTFTLDTIPRKSTLSADNGTLGVAQTLKVTKKASRFTHTIRYAIGNDYWTIALKASETTIPWTPPIERASYNTTGTSIKAVLTIITYNGSDEIGTDSVTISLAIPSSVKPTCSPSVTDPTGIKDIYGYFVNGLSKCRVVIDATIAYGSDIAAYSAQVNDAAYSAKDFTTDWIREAGTLTVSATVKDKRGRTGSWSGSYNVLDYEAPKVTALTVHRCNEDGSENDQGEFVQVTFSAAVTALRDRNTAKYKLRYKKSVDANYTEVEFTDLANTYTISRAVYVFPADSDYAYEVEVTASDRHGTYTRVTSASTAFTLMNWHPGGRGMGFGMVAEETGLASALALKLYGGIESVTVDKAKSSRLALGIGKHLWGTSDWSAASPNITVGEIQNYTLLRLKVKGVNANILAFNNGGNLRGIGGFAEGNRHRSYAMSAVVDGTALTMTVCNLTLHTSGGAHSTIEDVSISDIWGIF